MQAAEILGKTPGQLFPGNESAVRKLFKQLAAAWHPDHCKDPKAGDVFAHLARSRDVALGKSSENRVAFTLKPAGNKLTMDYLRASTTEAGRLYVGASSVCYLLPEANRDLAAQAISMRWGFPNKKIEQEITKYLPNRVRHQETTEGVFLAYRRTPDQVLMSDLIAWERLRGGGKLAVDYRSVMWMVSSLLNTCCYLEVQRTAHCGLVPEYLLVSLDQHAVAWTGPCLYATPYGHRPKAVPRAVLEAFPQLRAPTFKVENSRVDLTMVRQLAMRLLGHTNTVLLKRDTALPEAMRQWLCSPAPASAVADYAAWEQARGKRAFTAYGATAADVYLALRN